MIWLRNDLNSTQLKIKVRWIIKPIIYSLQS